MKEDAKNEGKTNEHDSNNARGDDGGGGDDEADESDSEEELPRKDVRFVITSRHDSDFLDMHD